MKAIILAGGFGTRLKTVVPDLPKPMAPIAGRPFLAYLIDYLSAQGITHFILSVHHLADKICDYFKTSYANIEYVYENEPLGTGGAIHHVLSQVEDPQPIFILNGDTFVTLKYRQWYAKHLKQSSPISMALTYVENCERYGSVVVEDECIIAFNEKQHQGEGYINAGVYLLNPNLFSAYNMPAKFSFEHDFLLPNIKALKPYPYLTQGEFIDIGIPSDYERAQVMIPPLL